MMTKNEKAGHEELRAQDTRVLFEGRTLVVECRFYTVIHYTIVSERIRAVCSGLKLRMAVAACRAILTVPS
jgi:hypothetical protein